MRLEGEGGPWRGGSLHIELTSMSNLAKWFLISFPILSYGCVGFDMLGGHFVCCCLRCPGQRQSKPFSSLPPMLGKLAVLSRAEDVVAGRERKVAIAGEIRQRTTVERNERTVDEPLESAQLENVDGTGAMLYKRLYEQRPKAPCREGSSVYDDL